MHATDFRLLFEGLPGLYLILSPELEIVAVSDAYLQATMTTRPGLVGKHLFEAFPDDPKDPTADGVRNLRTSLERVQRARVADTMAVQKYSIQLPDGSYAERHWSPMNSPLLDADGNLRFIIHRVEEVTEYVRLRTRGSELQTQAERMDAEVYQRGQEVAAAKRDLERAHVELGKLYTRTRDLDATKTAFFANVSHELRTPLALILGPTARVLARADLDEAVRQDVALVQRHAQLLLKQVNDLLDVAKLEAGKMTLAYSQADLAHLVRVSASYFQSAATDQQIDLLVDAWGAVDAQLDPDKLERVMVNLISNALKFTPPGGRIRVSLRQEEERGIIEVADSGPGIPEAHREAVFERFRQLDDGPGRRVGGTGLGLAIARDFVTLHGGTLAVDLAPEGGARFVTELPLRAPPGTEISPPLQGRATVPPVDPVAPFVDEVSEERRDLPRVLVVEDNPEMNLFIRECLAADYQTYRALDGEEGLRKALELSPDLIISDLMMPRLTGEQLVHAVRSWPRLENVPIILLSARGDDELRIRLLRDGAQDYLTKPFAADELRVRVGNLVRAKQNDERNRRLNAELTDGLERFQRLARELEAASRFKSEFLASMSHELRTPLNAILGFGELLHDERVGPLTPEQRDFLGDILTSGRHLLQVINDVLDLSKVEAGKLEFHPESVNLEQVLAEIVVVLRSVASARRVRLRVEASPDVGLVTVDPARLKQVLYNYASNAVKFTSEGGTVTLAAHIEDGRSFRVEVTDDGVGIAPEDLDKLFVEFQQVGRLANKPGGTGLGLALTKRMVEAQGGRVGVTSVVGKGSTFFAVLPRHARPNLTLPPPSYYPAQRADAPLILVVEDDPQDQLFLVAALGAAGYAVETAATRQRALMRCAERTFDAITLDLLLPDAVGLEVIAEIRAGTLNASTPIVVVSVVAEREAMGGFSVHDVLAKPLDPERLLSSLGHAGVVPLTDGRIVVVDDNPTARQLMETTLAQLGFRTIAFSEGAEALASVASIRPLAVVLDLMMPGMNGFEFLERFRDLPDVHAVPVIIWTAKDLSPEEGQLLSEQAEAVVAKGPHTANSVVSQLQATLR